MLGPHPGSETIISFVYKLVSGIVRRQRIRQFLYRGKHRIPVKAWAAVQELVAASVDLGDESGLIYSNFAALELADSMPLRLCDECSVEKPL